MIILDAQVIVVVKEGRGGNPELFLHERWFGKPMPFLQAPDRGIKVAIRPNIFGVFSPGFGQIIGT